MKVCNRCGFTGESDLFRESRLICKKCHNSETAKAVTKWRQKTKIRMVEYLGGSCSVCGYNKCMAALHIHHAIDKEFSLSAKGMTRSWEKIEKELKKCILLCANCHMEHHFSVV